jgi:hypothetical protein
MLDQASRADVVVAEEGADAVDADDAARSRASPDLIVPDVAPMIAERARVGVRGTTGAVERSIISIVERCPCANNPPPCRGSSR